MTLQEFLIQKNILDLVGLGGLSEEEKNVQISKFSQEILTRSLERLMNENAEAKDFITKKVEAKGDMGEKFQTDLMNKFPDFSKILEEEAVFIKVQLFQSMLEGFSTNINALDESQENKEYLVYLVTRLKEVLSGNLNTELSDDDVKDFDLYLSKAKQYNFIS